MHRYRQRLAAARTSGRASGEECGRMASGCRGSCRSNEHVLRSEVVVTQYYVRTKCHTLSKDYFHGL